MEFINLVLGLMGLSFFSSGVGFWFYILKGNKSGLRLTATVHDNIQKDGKNNRYYPVLQFYTETRRRQITYHMGYKTPKYKVGDEVSILYSPTEETAIIKGDKTNQKLTALFLLIGAVLLVLCFAI